MVKYWKYDGIRRIKRKKKYPREARKFISKHIRKHIKVYGMPRDQAIAVALEEARQKGYKIPKP